jgi:Domain of unknown function (DUF4347)
LVESQVVSMKKKSIQNRYKSKLILEELEARQLFSGGAEAVIPPPDNTPPPTVINVEPVAENQTQAPVIQSNSDHTTPVAATSIQDNAAALASPAETVTRHEIAFVDTQVKDYQQLVDDLNNQNDAQRQIEVVLLTAGQDGIQQISETLQNRHDIDAIHIFSHGLDGAVELGGTQRLGP